MNELLSSEIQFVIGDEKIDFSVSATRAKPFEKSIYAIVTGLGVLVFISFVLYTFFEPLFKGEALHFKANGVQTSANWQNFQPLIIPALILSVFVFAGLGMLLYGIYALLEKGGIFVGTNNRLIHSHKGNIKTYDWEQFSGNMTINSKNNDLSLQLRTGKMEHRKNSADAFVPDVIYISGVPDMLEIEKICKKRIKENDPTLANKL